MKRTHASCTTSSAPVALTRCRMDHPTISILHIHGSTSSLPETLNEETTTALEQRLDSFPALHKFLITSLSPSVSQVYSALTQPSHDQKSSIPAYGCKQFNSAGGIPICSTILFHHKHNPRSIAALPDDNVTRSQQIPSSVKMYFAHLQPLLPLQFNKKNQASNSLAPPFPKEEAPLKGDIQSVQRPNLLHLSPFHPKKKRPRSVLTR